MVKTDSASKRVVPVSAEVSAPAAMKASKSARTFASKRGAKTEDLRAVFDDTCARYPKTLARLAE